jgi:rhodanese-related sulfurtransferase
MITKKIKTQIILFITLIMMVLVLSGCGPSLALPDSPVIAVDTINVDEAYQLYQEGTAFLDVRTQEEWQEAHIPGATLLPLDQLESQVGSLPKDQDIVIYCRTGNRSNQAARILMEAGFDRIQDMGGGIESWISAGYEVDN